MRNTWCRQQWVCAVINSRLESFASVRDVVWCIYMQEKPHKCVREREGDDTTSCIFVWLDVSLHLLQNLTAKKAVTAIKFTDPITCLFYVTLLWVPSTQNPILTSQRPIFKKKKKIIRWQEILGENYFSLLLHELHRKRRVQKFLYCCMRIRCSHKVFTEPLPSNDRRDAYRHTGHAVA
jgi:hypothetical protein